MQSKLRKYQIGLAALGLFTLVIVVVILVQAGATKQDADTTKKANDIATKLEMYISTKQMIPDSLGAVGVSDVPATISYQKLSDTSYRFCLTYKSASSGFDAASAVTDVATGSYGQRYSSLGNTTDTETGDTGYLYIPDTHHKGSNCQTIKPYIYASPYYPYSQPSTKQPLLDTMNGMQEKARDTERTTDLKTLQSQLEAYYALNGYYPTLANLNDLSWVASNMPGMDKETLRDPQGGGYSLVAAPTKHAYAYEVYDDSYQTCTVAENCTSYILTATPETGDPIIEESLNY